MKKAWLGSLVFIFSFASMVFAGERLEKWPVAPEQELEWKLPQGMEDGEGKILKAVNELFKLGMSDPRGLDYHHVKVKEGGKVLDGRGWLLPKREGDGGRFAIGWSGLVYPVVEVGKKADLKADIELVKTKGRFGKEPFYNYSGETLNDLVGRFVGSARMMHPFAAPYLLLRLGEKVEVSTLESVIDPFAAPDEDGRRLMMPEFSSEGELIEVLFEYSLHVRADGVAAFLDKDDRVVTERSMVSGRFWAEAIKRISPEQIPKDEGDDPFIDDPFDDYDVVSIPDINSSWWELLRDAKRRLEQVEPATATKIEKAIASWENLVRWDKKSPPEAFRKVVAYGPSAIMPLLRCLESDPRWTRAVIGRDYERRVLRVRDLAIFALEEVLQFSIVEFLNSQGPPEAGWYEEIAIKMRAFCERYDYQFGGELWYRILKDEKASLDHQFNAAIAIVVPEAVDYYDWGIGGYFFADEIRGRYESPNTSKEGAILRDGRKPSVESLLKKVWMRDRASAEAFLKKWEGTFFRIVSDPPAYPRSRSQMLMRCLEEWQPGNIQVLKGHYVWMADGLVGSRKSKNGAEFFLLRDCEETLIRRIWAGDATAVEDYRGLWRGALKGHELPTQVMIEFPEKEGMDGLLAEAFLGKESPLSFGEKGWRFYDRRSRLVEDGRSLLRLPSYRKALVEGLRNRKIQGVLFEKDGILMAKFSADKKREVDRFYPNGGLRGEKLGDRKVDLRMCDLVANALTPSYGDDVWITPDFRLDDPVAKRDELIADWIKLLEVKR